METFAQQDTKTPGGNRILKVKDHAPANTYINSSVELVRLKLGRIQLSERRSLLCNFFSVPPQPSLIVKLRVIDVLLFWRECSLVDRFGKVKFFNSLNVEAMPRHWIE